MKHSIFLCFMIVCASCLTNPNDADSKQDSLTAFGTNEITVPNSKKEYTKTFKEFGFSIKTPCVLEDVSSQANGDFEANYGGIINPDDPDNVTAYQIVVIKIPIGIEDYTESEKKDLIDQQLSMRMVNFSNVKRVLFSDNEYIGYVGDTHHNGLKQRGVMFNKDRYIIALTVMTNSDLDLKFNEFTNSFKVINK